MLLLPLAPAPWIAALALERSRARALFSGILFGLAFWCASIPWITFVVTRYGGQSGFMGIVCLFLLAAILAEWPALVAWGTVAFAPERSRGRFFAFPLLWMASEHARSYVYKGFPWNLTGSALYRHPLWLQTAAVWGVYGVGALVMGVAALLAAGSLSRRVRPLLVASALVLLAGVFGAMRLGRPAGTPEGFPAVPVALLQPNLSEEQRHGEGEAASYLHVLDLANQAARSRPTLIVVPESAFPLYWDRSAALRRDLTDGARESGGVILFNDVEETRDGTYYNVARLASEKGLVGGPYRKVHLVPFGEYVPLPKLFFFVRQISTEIGAFSAADSPAILEGEGMRIGVGICYEILYPTLSRVQVADRGANLLVTISNDSWYGRAGAQAQHFAGALLRSVETQRYLLRAAITGISGIVDEKGRIVAELGPDRPGILRGSARLVSVRTAWVRWGYWIPRLADGGALAVLVFGFVRWRRTRHPG